jgi:hypothetical protein
MKNKGKLIANLKKTIGEDKWLVISGFGAVAALTALSAMPKVLALVKRDD